jgi:hypothetical protein
MLVLFRPQIEALLQERGAGVLARQREHPEVENIYEDRRLEVTSQMAISVEAGGRARKGARTGLIRWMRQSRFTQTPGPPAATCGRGRRPAALVAFGTRSLR